MRLRLSTAQEALFKRIKRCLKGYAYTPREEQSVIILEKLGLIMVASYAHGAIAYPKEEKAQ